jgi:hypothetical protein
LAQKIGTGEQQQEELKNIETGFAAELGFIIIYGHFYLVEKKRGSLIFYALSLLRATLTLSTWKKECECHKSLLQMSLNNMKVNIVHTYKIHNDFISCMYYWSSGQTKLWTITSVKFLKT